MPRQTGGRRAAPSGGEAPAPAGIMDRLHAWWRARRARMELDTVIPLPSLWTPRLHLRPFLPGDAQGILGYAGDPKTAEFMVWKRHRGLTDSQAALDYFMASYARGDDMPVAIIRRADGRLLGCSGFQYPLRSAPWMAWILRSDAWGQGYAAEAVRALLTWGWRAYPKWRRVEAPIHPGNKASIVLAERLGFRKAAGELTFEMGNRRGRAAKAGIWALERPR
jgi:ribosomal-protein-alanine N-acetyltransferase